jgi:glucosamine--fructose-6-phosphate aminotransferase (isomerizing)
MYLATLRENDFLKDILAQPDALRYSLGKLDFSSLEPLGKALHQGEIDRVVFTGMGASYYALYTAWLRLAAAGYPAIWVDCAELVHHTPALIGPKTLLVVASQSGRSAEIVALLSLLAGRAAQGFPLAGLAAITNDLQSPLATAALLMAEASKQHVHAPASVLLPLHTQPEQAVSTRTYVITLAIAQLAAYVLSRYAPAGGGNLQSHLDDLAHTIEGIQVYLTGWEKRLEQIGEAVGAPASSPPILLGRGLSLASAYEGALNIEEAAKLPAIGLQAAEFRHGPLEIAGPGQTALVFAGEPGVRALNFKLWGDLRAKGVNALWIEPPGESMSAANVLPMPAAAGFGLPLAEIVPVQLLCVHLCLALGLKPGQFRYIEKVTTVL